MSGKANITLGEAIFCDIDYNDFLNRLYEDLLYNYALLKLNLKKREPRPIKVNAALRFADLLSKSTHPSKADDHKMWAQAIVTLLLELYPKNDSVTFYAGAVLTSIGNFRGRELSRKIYDSKYYETNLQEKAFAAFMDEYLSIPAENGKKFFIPQKYVYDRIKDNSFSYSAPTSMGKSFVMEVFIKEQIKNGEKLNFARIVPTKALINEIREDTVKGLGNLLEEKNYCVVTSVNDYALEETHNFILIMTPERLLYLITNNSKMAIDYVFIDEAHKLTGRNKRGPFYYKAVDILARRRPKPHFIFASPNIPNPEIYLQLITKESKEYKNAVASTFSPVTQFKFLVNHNKRSICIFNDHTQNPITVCSYGNKSMSVVELMNIMNNISKDVPLAQRPRNIAYFQSKNAAIAAAVKYAKNKDEVNDAELNKLSNDICSQIHEFYYLAKMVKQGIAYHVGYLPSSIRLRIEKLFKDGKINAMFCTSTLIEGVNLPADNLFITNNHTGKAKMTNVEFRNLVGRVGRIKFNLYGNVFFISDGDKVREEEFVKLLREPIPKQKLTISEALKPKLKNHIVDTLCKGTAQIERYVTPSGSFQSEEEYVMMRKFGLILLKDIMEDRDSLVRREFSKQLTDTIEKSIRNNFERDKTYIYDDINISSDQSRRLAKAIRAGISYPRPRNGRFDYGEMLLFLEKLSDIFNWEKYEFSTLGRKNNHGKHAKLGWYAVILCHWMEGHGLHFIMQNALQYTRDNPDKFWANGKFTHFDDSSEHRNIVFADTLEAIENVILFSISNYFLRFSNMYAKIYGEDALSDNNWYEFVEYGTTNSITVFLQRSGFSREAANFIKDHPQYIIDCGEGKLKLRRSLLEANHNDAREESKLILLNRPQVFEEV